MKNEVATRAAGGALSAAQQMLKGNLRKVTANLPTGNRAFLKFLQDGSWVFGADNSELAKGTEVAINPLSVKQGYSCWTDYPKSEKKKNELLAEVTVGLGEDLPPKHTLKDYGYAWRDLRVVELKVLTGQHKGKELSFSTTSDGGLRMIGSLLEQVMLQLDEDPDFFVPVVELGSDFYMHKQWGKTYTPEMNVVSFMTIDGEEDEAEEPVKEPEPVEAPRVRATRAPKVEVPEEAPEEEPEEELDEPAKEPAPEDGAVRRRRR